MDNNLAREAISSALRGDWKEAVTLNNIILKKDRRNIEALNRLSRAYAELGNLKKSREFSRKVLTLDPFNKIAQKCLDKWKGLKKAEINSSCPGEAAFFIEEPGKTLVTPLTNLRIKNLLAKLYTGDEVLINPQGQRLSILTPDGKYLGRVPDLIGARLKKRLKQGYGYCAIIKSIEARKVEVFIKETSINL